MAWLTWSAGQLPWIGLSLAISFCAYGLLRKRATLTLQMPANVKSATAEIDWLATSFGGLGCTALAHALDMTLEAMLDAAHDDGRLLRGIAFSACAERNWPILTAIANGRLPDVWHAFLQTGLASFGLVTQHERREWASAAIPAIPYLVFMIRIVGIACVAPVPLGYRPGKAGLPCAARAAGSRISHRAGVISRRRDAVSSQAAGDGDHVLILAVAVERQVAARLLRGESTFRQGAAERGERHAEAHPGRGRRGGSGQRGRGGHCRS